MATSVNSIAPLTEQVLPGPADAAPQPDRRYALAGVTIALLLVVVAWLVGGQVGWDTIGGGGINQRLLPKVGELAPDFETLDLLGNPVKLSDFRGQPVWLMFWGSWCPPCRAEFPDIQAAYAQLEPNGIRMLGVSLREPAMNAALYASQNNATFLVLSDPDESDTGASYPIRNFPTHIFIGADGIVRKVVLEDMSTAEAIENAQSILDPTLAANP